MDGMLDPHDPRLAQAWETLKAHHGSEDSLKPESNRLAFADPEFLLRRETRGLRMQLEMLKPDLAQIERGIEHTVVVFRKVSQRRSLAPATDASAGQWRSAANRQSPSAGAQRALLRAISRFGPHHHQVQRAPT